MMAVLKEILEVAAIHTIERGIKKTNKLIQIKSTKKYIEAVEIARKTWLSFVSAQLFLFLSAVSVVGLLVTGLLLATVDGQTKLWIAFGTCSAFFLLFAYALYLTTSEKKWLEFSGANKLIEKIINRPY